MDISYAVQQLRPTPLYSGIANTYAELLETWVDPREVPTEIELQDVWDAHVAEQDLEDAELANLKTEMADLISSTTYADLETKVDTIFADHTTAQRTFLLKVFRTVLFLGKRNLEFDTE